MPEKFVLDMSPVENTPDDFEFKNLSFSKFVPKTNCKSPAFFILSFEDEKGLKF